MKHIDVLLINPNRLFPPIAPVGIDCLESYLLAKGCSVEVLDLNPCTNLTQIEKEIRTCFSIYHPVITGISIRNIDDSSFFSSRFLLAGTKKIMQMVRENSRGPVVLGGAGFSVMPGLIVNYLQSDYGIEGDGEEPLYALVTALKEGGSVHSIPGLCYRKGDTLVRNKPLFKVFPEKEGIVFARNIWYFREGGQIGIETKRGCDGMCTYCVDPIAKGRKIRLRHPPAIARELESYVRQGITCFHTCDSEFNRPPEHAVAVCRAIREKGIQEDIQIYAYCSPVPFSHTLAQEMKQAGFAGINFGSDHVHDPLLSSLGRDHTSRDVISATYTAKDAGLQVMHDLLLGSPFETEETLGKVIKSEKEFPVDCVGVSTGIRMYPGTPFYRKFSTDNEKYLSGHQSGIPLAPLFYMKPEKERIIPLLCTLIGDDKRFFFQPLGEKYNYNYADNTRLLKAIHEGARGAYWNILINM